MRRVIAVWFFALAVVSCRGQVETPTAPPKRSAQTNVVAAGRVPLSAANIDAFLAWASRAGAEEFFHVREAIVSARGDNALLPPLLDRLQGERGRDLSKGLVLLSVIGELKNPAAAERLESFIWQPLPAAQTIGHDAFSERGMREILEAKAVECVSYLGTTEADAMTVRVIREHPSPVVRAAAVDAYLFNHGDSEAAKEELRRAVQKGDEILIDRVRKSAHVSRETFNAGLARFYELHPNAVAPPPGPPSADAVSEPPPGPARE